MQMDSLIGGAANGGYEPAKISKESLKIEPKEMDYSDLEIMPVQNHIQVDTEDAQEQMNGQQGKEKEPAKSSIDAAFSLLNSQIEKTHCAYSYDEETKRVSIKVYDDETEELIREVPPEKTLEALKKIWEIAGIIIDEKR